MHDANHKTISVRITLPNGERKQVLGFLAHNESDLRLQFVQLLVGGLYGASFLESLHRHAQQVAVRLDEKVIGRFVEEAGERGTWRFEADNERYENLERLRGVPFGQGKHLLVAILHEMGVQI